MNYGITIQVFLLNISGKNTHFGVTAILCSVGKANPDTIRKYIESQG
jgi:hypothetical protein